MNEEFTSGSGPPDPEPPAETAKREKLSPPRGKGGRHAAPKKKRKQRPLLRFLVKLALVAAIFISVFTVVLGAHIHHGNRMYPFIMDGDLLITYKLDDYYVGDAVLYKDPETGETAVSRIAAIGASEIQITELGELLIDGIVPNEQVFYATKQLDGSDVLFPYRMSGAGYFLLDDYRTIGEDSRLFGEVTEDALLGKIVYVFRRRGI